MQIESNVSINNRWYFHVKNDEGRIVLQSELYGSKEKLEGGILLAKSHYHRGVTARESSNGRFYYVLEDGGGNILGRSPGRLQFDSEAEAVNFGNSVVSGGHLRDVLVDIIESSGGRETAEGTIVVPTDEPAFVPTLTLSDEPAVSDTNEESEDEAEAPEVQPNAARRVINWFRSLV